MATLTTPIKAVLETGYSTPRFTLKAGDTLPAIRVQIVSALGAADLTGCTVVFRFWPAGCCCPTGAVIESTATVENAAKGIVVYEWQDGKILYHGQQAAELLLARQLKSIERLKQRGVTVKVNFIVVPGVNDHHVEETARFMAGMGVDLFNCMALLPNEGTVFADVVEPDKETMARLRTTGEKYLPQMRHCKRCRADAVGLLGADRSGEMAGCLSACASMPANPSNKRPYVAVASMEGMLVNQHLGETTRFMIWEQVDDNFRLVEERPAPIPGSGIGRWQAMTRILYDCRAVLASDMGETPREILRKQGIEPVTMSGFIEMGLKAIYSGEGLSQLKRREKKSCGSGHCQGTGTGCG